MIVKAHFELFSEINRLTMNIGVCSVMQQCHVDASGPTFTRYFSCSSSSSSVSASSPPAMDYNYYSRPVYQETMSLTSLLDTGLGQPQLAAQAPVSASFTWDSFSVSTDDPATVSSAYFDVDYCWDAAEQYCEGGRPTCAKTDALTMTSSRLQSPLKSEAQLDWSSSSGDDAIVDIIDSLFSDLSSAKSISSPPSCSSASSLPPSPKRRRVTAPDESCDSKTPVASLLPLNNIEALPLLHLSSNSEEPFWSLPDIDKKKPPSYEHALQATSEANVQLLTRDSANRNMRQSDEDSTKSVMDLYSPDNYTGSGQVQLWQYLLEMLADSDSHGQVIRWDDRPGEFTMHDPEEVARRWGKRKNRAGMNYDKMGRALRYYYDRLILAKVAGKRFTYRFNAKGLQRLSRRKSSSASSSGGCSESLGDSAFSLASYFSGGRVMSPNHDDVTVSPRPFLEDRHQPTGDDVMPNVSLQHRQHQQGPTDCALFGNIPTLQQQQQNQHQQLISYLPFVETPEWNKSVLSNYYSPSSYAGYDLKYSIFPY